jgi:hypothetical protein
MSRLNMSDTPASSGEQRNGMAGDAEKTEAAAQGPAAPQDGTKPDGEPAEPSSLDRVEEMMDQFGKKVGSMTSQLGQQLFRWGAHLREAAEDCWAEAQSIRRGEPQQESAPEDSSPIS